MADHTKEIFNLACEGHQLKERVTQEFAKLSNQEVLFHTQAQSTSYEMLASGHLDCFTAYYAILQAIEELLNKASEVWLWANASLFKLVLDYEAKLDAFLDRTGGWIRALEERIWMMMARITKDLRAPLCASLAIVFCLLDTFPSFPANLAYQNTSPIITGFVPKAYAQQPWLGLHSLDLTHTLPPDSHRKAEDILKEAILCSTGGKAATTVSTGPSTSTSTAPNELPQEGFPSTSSPTVRSPTKCKCTRSPSPHHLWSGSSSSGRGSASDRGSRGSHLSSSGSSGSGSNSGSGSGSHDGSPARSEASGYEGSVHSWAASDGSVEVLSADEASGGEEDVLDSTNKADISQGSMSAWHLCCRWWGHSQMQGAQTCPQKWHWLCGVERQTHPWWGDGYTRVGQHCQWLYWCWKEEA